MDKTLLVVIICVFGVVGMALCVRTIMKAMDGKQRLAMTRIEVAHTLAELRDHNSSRG